MTFDFNIKEGIFPGYLLFLVSLAWLHAFLLSHNVVPVADMPNFLPCEDVLSLSCIRLDATLSRLSSSQSVSEAGAA